MCVGVLALSLALQNSWKAKSAWSAQFAEPWYRIRLAIGSRYSQNQSQGNELDVYKEKVGAETEGMAPAKGDVLWHGRSRSRGSHASHGPNKSIIVSNFSPSRKNCDKVVYDLNFFVNIIEIGLELKSFSFSNIT